ncbi:MAG: hypothetical protein KAS67_01795 [Thermoplasmata archaeon]|nr:hypothetical protein [Thermoplasmata archaeon]
MTIEDMKVAISKTLGTEMTEDEVDLMANHIMSFFGFREVIIDNKLTARDRDIFYQLENEGLLKTDNEEATLKKGKRWRIHYWVLNRDYIIKLSRGPEEEEVVNAYDVYTDEEMWDRNSDDEDEAA